MIYRQATQPIHLQHGRAWTTSLAICHACDLNHAVLTDIIRSMGKDDQLNEADSQPLFIAPPENGASVIHGYQMSEQGARKLMNQIDTMLHEGPARVNFLAGAEVILSAFAMDHGLTGTSSRSGWNGDANKGLSNALHEMGQVLQTLAGKMGGASHE